MRQIPWQACQQAGNRGRHANARDLRAPGRVASGK